MDDWADNGEEQARSEEVRGPGLASAIVAILALTGSGFFYWVAQSSIAGLGLSDPAGNGLGAAFAFFGEMLLWLCLAIYLVAQCWRGHLPIAIKAAIAIGWALMAWASVAAITVMDGQRQGATWLRLFPSVLPWLAVLLGLWVRGARHLHPRTWLIGMAGFALLAAPLVLLALIEKSSWDAGAPARAAEMDAANDAALRQLEDRIRASEDNRLLGRPD